MPSSLAFTSMVCDCVPVFFFVGFFVCVCLVSLPGSSVVVQSMRI